MYDNSFMIPNPYIKKRPVRASTVGIRSDKKQIAAISKAPRQHSFYYVYEGEFSVKIDNSSFVAKAGDMYWTPEKQFHNVQSAPNAPWKYIFISINDEFIYNMLKAYKIKNTYHFAGFNDPSLFEEFMVTAKEPCEPDELIDKLTVIFLRIVQKMRRMMDDVTFKPSEAPKLANFIKSYIDLDTVHGFNLDDITARTYCSKNHAIRVFKQSFGITPYQYLLEKKITIAKDMLLDSNYTIKQIADLLQFKSPNDFSTFFKRNTGLTPTEFKRKNI